MLAWVLTLALFAGVSAKSFRISGGEITTIENFPSTVQVEFESGNGVWSQNCAGVIVTNLHVLTSAYCIAPWGRIRAGATHRSVGGSIYYISNVVRHPGNIFNTFINDIALARTVTPFVYSPTVQQTAIPPQGSVVPENLPVTRAGWAGNEHGGALRYANFLTWNYNLCKTVMVSNPDFPQAGQDWLCAERLDHFVEPNCSGDYGGPLYYGNLTIGIQYMLSNCHDWEDNINYPSVNTNVASHTQWIIDNAI